MQKKTLVVAALAASALALAGCSGTAGDTASDDGVLRVATSTNVYGQIVSEIAGDAVEVTSIVSSSAQDPHDYEATASDQLSVQRADLIIENGGGYDAFMDSLIEASGSTAPVIVASEFSHDYPGADADERETATPTATGEAADDHADDAATGEAADDHADDDHAEEGHAEDGHDHDHAHIEGFNEHVWYDPHTIVHVAEAIADELTTLLPDDADTIEANLATFSDGIEGLESSLGEIEAAHAGAGVFVTEPVPGYLVAAAGLVNATPEEFSESVEEGQDVPPATLLAAIEELNSGHVAIVIANSQTGGAETTQVIDTADSAGIPVLEFSETLPEGETYIQWMQQNIDDLAAALSE